MATTQRKRVLGEVSGNVAKDQSLAAPPATGCAIGKPGLSKWLGKLGSKTKQRLTPRKVKAARERSSSSSKENSENVASKIGSSAAFDLEKKISALDKRVHFALSSSSKWNTSSDKGSKDSSNVLSPASPSSSPSLGGGGSESMIAVTSLCQDGGPDSILVNSPGLSNKPRGSDSLHDQLVLRLAFASTGGVIPDTTHKRVKGSAANPTTNPSIKSAGLANCASSGKEFSSLAAAKSSTKDRAQSSKKFAHLEGRVGSLSPLQDRVKSETSDRDVYSPLPASLRTDSGRNSACVQKAGDSESKERDSDSRKCEDKTQLLTSEKGSDMVEEGLCGESDYVTLVRKQQPADKLEQHRRRHQDFESVSRQLLSLPSASELPSFAVEKLALPKEEEDENTCCEEEGESTCDFPTVDGDSVVSRSDLRDNVEPGRDSVAVKGGRCGSVNVQYGATDRVVKPCGVPSTTAVVPQSAVHPHTPSKTAKGEGQKNVDLCPLSSPVPLTRSPRVVTEGAQRTPGPATAPFPSSPARTPLCIHRLKPSARSHVHHPRLTHTENAECIDSAKWKVFDALRSRLTTSTVASGDGSRFVSYATQTDSAYVSAYTTGVSDSTKFSRVKEEDGHDDVTPMAAAGFHGAADAPRVLCSRARKRPVHGRRKLASGDLQSRLLHSRWRHENLCYHRTTILEENSEEEKEEEERSGAYERLLERDSKENVYERLGVMPPHHSPSTPHYHRHVADDDSPKHHRHHHLRQQQVAAGPSPKKSKQMRFSDYTQVYSICDDSDYSTVDSLNDVNSVADVSSFCDKENNNTTCKDDELHDTAFTCDIDDVSESTIVDGGDVTGADDATFLVPSVVDCTSIPNETVIHGNVKFKTTLDDSEASAAARTRSVTSQMTSGASSQTRGRSRDDNDSVFEHEQTYENVINPAPRKTRQQQQHGANSCNLKNSQNTSTRTNHHHHHHSKVLKPIQNSQGGSSSYSNCPTNTTINYDSSVANDSDMYEGGSVVTDSSDWSAWSESTVGPCSLGMSASGEMVCTVHGDLLTSDSCVLLDDSRCSEFLGCMSFGVKGILRNKVRH
jgi:hypothetical protein